MIDDSKKMYINRDIFTCNKSTYKLFIVLLVLLLVSVLGLIVSIDFDVPIVGVLILYFIIFSAIFYESRNDKELALIILLLILCLQPLLTSFFSFHLGSSEIKAMVAIKDVAAVSFFLALVVYNYRIVTRLKIPDVIAISFVILLLFSLITSSAPMFLKLLSVRESINIVLFYFIGRLIAFKIFDYEKLYKALIVVVFIYVVIAIVDRLCITSQMWETVGAFKYIEGKFDVNYLNGFPVNWSTYLTSDVTARRTVGSILEPTSFSRLLAVLILAMMFLPRAYNKYKNKTVILMVLMSIIVLFLSFSRGGIVIFFMGLSVYVFFKSSSASRFLVMFIMLIIVYLVINNSSLFSLESGNSIRHLTGLANGVGSIKANFMGHGIGSSGQMAASYGMDQIDDVIGESYIGSLSYQLGTPGLTIFSIFFFSIFYYLIINVRLVDFGLSVLAISFGVSIYLTSFLANSAVSPISSGFALVIVGMVMSEVFKRKSTLTNNFLREKNE